MGCGTSKQAAQASVVDEQVSVVDEALLSHLANVLEIPKEEAIIKQYAAVLRSEGWDTPKVRHGVDIAVAVYGACIVSPLHAL